MNIKYVVLYKSMVKHKKNLEEGVEDLAEEIKTAEIHADSGADLQKEIERKREELTLSLPWTYIYALRVGRIYTSLIGKGLIKLAEDGLLRKTLILLKKKVIGS